jgi:hypothetical protein
MLSSGKLRFHSASLKIKTERLAAGEGQGLVYIWQPVVNQKEPTKNNGLDVEMMRKGGVERREWI